MNPHIPYYRPLGRPATASVVVTKVPTATPTVTVNGVVYTFGTNFVGLTVNKIAQSLAAAINSDISRFGFEHNKTSPISDVFAIFYGATVVLIATEPGTAGNAYTLATSSAEHFTVSGATFSGGAAVGGMPTTDNGPAWTDVQNRVTSADLSAAAVDLTAAPTAGQKLVITDLYVSADTAMEISLKEETTGTVRWSTFVPANGSAALVCRGKFKHPVADKKWQLQTSVAGNIRAFVLYHSEA